MEGAFERPFDGAGHEDFAVVGNLDVQLAAGHVDGDIAVHQAELVGGAGGRTRAAARGQRVAGAALPDADVDVRSVQDLEDLEVDPVGEHRVVLDVGPDLSGLLFSHVLHWDHAMRVADGQAGDLVCGPVDVEGFADHLARLAGNRDLVADERHLAHVDTDQAGGFVLDLYVHDPAERLDLEALRRHVPLLEQILGEDAQPVAALFGLAAVGIEDADRRHIAVEDRPVEDAVGADAEVPVADQPDVRLTHLDVPHVRVDHDIVISQSVILLEMYVHTLLS